MDSVGRATPAGPARRRAAAVLVPGLPPAQLKVGFVSALIV
ncbi:hypothetical protein [Sphaerimonospora thailandensis]|nr:hypothetical protein [Sphaerimonospora thailandensis]